VTTYYTRQIQIEAYQKQGGRSPLFKRGDAITKFNALDELAEGGIRKLAIPIPSVDLDLMQDGVAIGKALYIETDTEITVKLNNTSDTGVTVSPIVSTRNDLSDAPGVFYIEGSFTHVYITVSGDPGEANIVVVMLGE
jgi:hypothetical protein